jgi:hypothetical protein
MIKEVLNGHLNPYFASNVTMTAGTLVKYDPANPGYIIPAGPTDTPCGILAQDVISGNVDLYKLTSVTAKAHVGDKVGFYYDGGVYITDQFSGNITQPGTPLYVGTGSILSTVATSGGAGVIAFAETTGNSAVSGSTIRYKLAIN